MRSLTDRIERYLRVLIERSEGLVVEIQRAELAETFRCAPSQITYVLGTRFTVEDGFVTESKRGGRGFIRIRKIPLKGDDKYPEISRDQALSVIADLVARRIMSSETALIVGAILERIYNDPDVHDKEHLLLQVVDAILEKMEEMSHEM